MYKRSMLGEASRVAALRTPEVRAKMSASHKGKTPRNLPDAQKLAWQTNCKEILTYSGIHAWVRRTWGSPSICEKCGKSGLSSRQIHWANKDRKYTRLREDWMRLCRPCHYSHDHDIQGVNYFGHD